MTMQFSALKSPTPEVSASAMRVFRDELHERLYPGGWHPEAEGIPNPRYRPDLDINLSNANAAAVAAALGWHIVHGYLEVPIDQAIAACTAYLQQHIGRRSPELPARIIAGNPRFIDCGRREGYIEHQVHRIALMLREAKARGATHLAAA
jgi:hypothetical protein